MTGLRALATAALYLVLKSNGLRHSKNLPVKFGFSPRTVPANIAKKLPAQRCSKPHFIAFFSLSHKRPTFAFTGESGYTHSAFGERWHTRRNRGVSDGGGITTLGAFHTFRKPCVAGYQNGELCRFLVLVGGAPEGVAAPLGCVALLPLLVQPDLLGWKDLTRRSGRVTITRNSRTASRLALVWEPLRAVK